MLRRKPTALTISPEDLLQFEETHLRQKAYIHYKRTGEDPDGWFQQSQSHQQQSQNYQQSQQSQYQYQDSGKVNSKANTNAFDPNDELKPLPGDKARIVRGREERIIGSGNAGSGAGAGNIGGGMGGGGGSR